MRIRVPLIIEESVMQKIDEIAGEKHRRAAIVDSALREYIENHPIAPKLAAEAPTPKSKAKAAAVERKAKAKSGSRVVV